MSYSRILVLDASFKDGELLTEGEILRSQLRAVSKEGADEQEDNSEEGHRGLRLDKLVMLSMPVGGRKAKLAKAGRNFQ